MSKTGFSISSIESQVATEATYPFTPSLPNGDLQSGVVLQLYSEASPKLTAEIQALRDQHTSRELIVAARAAKARPGEVFISAAESDDYTLSLTGARIAGWSGLDDAVSPENKVRLLKAWTGLFQQVLSQARELASFTITSPKT